MTLVKKIYNTRDIIEGILYVDKKFYEDTKDFAQTFRGKNLEETARNIFDWIVQNLDYKEDGNNFQFVKRPRRLLNEKVGDCKSFSILTASILKNLGISYTFRFTAYNNKPNFGHVYVLAHKGNQTVIIDPVWGKFNSEKEFTSFKDFTRMEGLHIGSVDQSNKEQFKPLFVQYYPSIESGLDEAIKFVNRYVVADKRQAAKALIEQIRKDAKANPSKLIAYNGFSNAFLQGELLFPNYILKLNEVFTREFPEMGNIFDDIGDAFRKAWDNAGDAFRNATDEAGNFLRPFTDWAGNKISNLKEAAESAAKKIENVASEVGTTITGAVKDFAKDPWGWIKREAETAWKDSKGTVLKPMRDAYRLLLNYNFRGWATNLHNKSLADPGLEDQIKGIWEKWGGSGDFDKLQAAIRFGHSRDGILGIGAAPAVAAVPATVAGALTAAAGVIAAFASIMKNANESKESIQNLINEAREAFPEAAQKADELFRNYKNEQAAAAAAGDQDAIADLKRDNKWMWIGGSVLAATLLTLAFYKPSSNRKS